MKNLINDMPTGVSSFEEIVDLGGPYVDKTSFLADIITLKGKAWYLSRPRRFGKTLTVSTLENLFSGRRELFKGLAIEKHLGEKKFDPRPVLRLDMSIPATGRGLPVFEEHLARYLKSRAALLGVDLKSGSAFESGLYELVLELWLQSDKRGVAVLIDEYDAPLVGFLDRPHLLEDVRRIMRSFYMQLKGLNDNIFFLFATGVSRNSHLGLFSAVNHITDISIDTEYGAMLGFTQEELEKYFGPQIEASARSLQMTKSRFLDEMKDYYNGFSFDGQTRVYNPYSVLLFFSKKQKQFDNYWFDTGTPKILLDYMKNKHFSVEQFSGATVGRSFAKEPGALDTATPLSFLYQAGYLSLRLATVEAGGQEEPASKAPGEIPPMRSDRLDRRDDIFYENRYTLDYPNLEVRSAMSQLALASALDDEDRARELISRARDAFDMMDADGLVQAYNRILASLAHEDYIKQFTDAKDDPSGDPGELLFRSWLSVMLSGAGLTPISELHGSLGRSDIVVPHMGRHWVIELKISKNTVANDQAKAKEALDQILAKGYAERFDNPILLGLAVNKPKRKVTTWVKRVGLSGDDVWTLPEAPKPASKPPKPASKSPKPARPGRAGPRK